MRKVDIVNFDFTDFEDEIVVVDIQKGVYFSLKGDAPAIFRIFQEGAVIDQLTKIIESNYSLEVYKSFCAFIEVLTSHSILIASEVAVKSAIDEQILKAQLSENPDFIIEIQDNISDLIKLDPIHDVTPTKGWPNKAND